MQARWVTLSVDGGAMERIDLPFFYSLGNKLHALCEVTETSNRIGVLLPAIGARDEVEQLLRSFPSLTVCRQAGMALIQAIKEWIDSWPEDVRADMDMQEQWKVNAIVNKAKEFETVLSAELQTLAAYHVTQKGIYSTPDLIGRADSTLPGSVRSRLSREVIDELRESGRCLVFDNPTASGFHMMRATEAVMHLYYVAVCKPKSKEKLDNWGAYIAELKKCSDPDVPKVVAILQQIKDQDRNLIMHPEVVLSSDDAFTLFEVGKSAIIAMAGKLRAPRKTKKAAPSG